ncbi:GNAT family N-acetyltransferase [Agrobacterium rubi]|uniref:GNAT family N-acetyltransferase n=1 Tax=Agrobacterium rubi TaxID=28099 RepID=A0AAE7R5B5_9HYPH|nr:GNAT family N-acetyltransferase [Agrobacterium rubi]NTE85204.1 GNAT family N-acetyltransferase [Agrobacterium rubi]NTF01136.1 GNAT family N-acetyltransferase [Agrobacterium rubi]NTF35324.1 GNAT family N-acetyltransferase [Agrobacterium rubi]OCJ48660.1 GNAT family acetyltransferase [Agrobacterium rubi]QTG00523.1 GNAT family N-acetyltransferase [Agrobacterium rubi]
MDLSIRDARGEDHADWLGLWQDYLAFYSVDLPDDVTAHTWACIIDPASRVSARLAVLDGQVVGFAIHHFHDSTWVKTPDCYLEDLFIDATIRGKGIGRALIDDLISICEEKGWSRLYWHTNEDNAQARKLYDSYIKSDGHIRYRIKF